MSTTPRVSTNPPPNGPTTAHAGRRAKVVSNEAVAKLAYEKYVARGCEHGFDQQDWAQAQRELVADTLGKP